MDSMSIMETVKEWHEFAERDLSVAKHSLNMRPVPLEIIAYLCQQCGEKYLKSYLVYNDQDVVKTHDLIKLSDLCAAFDESFRNLKKQCKALSEYIVLTRYPSKLDLTDYHIKQALEYAGEIKDFVLTRINNGV